MPHYLLRLICQIMECQGRILTYGGKHLYYVYISHHATVNSGSVSSCHHTNMYVLI